MKNLSRICSLFLILMVACLVCACGRQEAEKEEVRLSIWCSEASIPLIEEAMERFVIEHAEDVTLSYSISAEEEDKCKETVLANPEAAADIFCFADDQLDELLLGGALLEITEDAEAVRASFGGADSGACRAAMRGAKLYAYPMTAGNGYFLYYNKSFFNEEDVQELDTILDKAARAGKYFTMDLSSGWYIYSFFKAAGLNLEANADGSGNLCNWNATDTDYTGVEVAQAMLDMAGHPGYVDLGDEGFTQGVAEGSVIAGINGAWNAEKVAAAWGDDYAAVKLPSCTIAGEQLQMCSFVGYKLMAVNAYSRYPEWSMRVAEYLTNEENQLRRFAAIGECPANVNAAREEEVQAAPAVAALAAQAEFGFMQRVADPFWTAAAKYGIVISSGNVDGRNLQELLDETVEEIKGTSGR